jgi:hypothetical protein
LVIQEANQVAKELRLQDELPITESNIVEFYIGPFGYNYTRKSIGSVSTTNFIYYVSQDNKFCYLEGTHQNEDCQKYQNAYTWPNSLIDTNQAYQLATQWMSAASMDIKALNRDCQITVETEDTYIHVPPGKFVPVYDIYWKSRDNVFGGASVRLFTPTKTLLQLRVEDPKYILRKPLVFTNLAALFPGTAPIHTNHPVKTIYMPAPPTE